MPKLETKGTLSVSDKFERKKSRKGVVRAGKEFTLFISNKDMDYIIKSVEPLEKSGRSIDGGNETVK